MNKHLSNHIILPSKCPQVALRIGVPPEDRGREKGKEWGVSNLAISVMFTSLPREVPRNDGKSIKSRQ